MVGNVVAMAGKGDDVMIGLGSVTDGGNTTSSDGVLI